MYTAEQIKPKGWYIDVLGTLAELKPLAYPENEPKEEGLFKIHLIKDDIWVIWPYMSNSKFFKFSWDENVDWFIPYNLKQKEKDGESLAIKGKTHKEDFNKIAELIRQHDSNEISTQDLLCILDCIVESALEGYEPELKPCPACGRSDYLEIDDDAKGFSVRCCSCEIEQATYYFREQDAIEAWNTLPRKEE